MDRSADSRRLEPDEPLPALGDLVGALFEDVVAVDASDDGAHVEALVVELPIEIDPDLTQVRCSPPTTYTETTVMPVFHRLTLRLERSDAG
jgi:hypothetical protein